MREASRYAPAMTDALIVWTTAPDVQTAEALADALVGEGLAACVNIVPGLRSIYRWRGAVERADELLCIIKTTRAGLTALRERLVTLHPYEVPELIALPIVDGHAAYLDWIAESVTAPGGKGPSAA
jgi:periplasmic divalent cation tolerance protein